MPKTDVLNPKFEIMVGEQKFMVKQVSISSILSIIEQKVKMQRINDATLVSHALPESERTSFLMKVWNELPKGADLSDLTMEFVQSVPGVICILTEAICAVNTKLDKDDVQTAVTDAINISNVDDFVKIAFRVLGVEDELEEGAKDPKKK